MFTLIILTISSVSASDTSDILLDNSNSNDILLDNSNLNDIVDISDDTSSVNIEKTYSSSKNKNISNDISSNADIYTNINDEDNLEIKDADLNDNEYVLDSIRNSKNPISSSLDDKELLGDSLSSEIVSGSTTLSVGDTVYIKIGSEANNYVYSYDGTTVYIRNNGSDMANTTYGIAISDEGVPITFTAAGEYNIQLCIFTYYGSNYFTDTYVFTVSESENTELKNTTISVTVDDYNPKIGDYLIVSPTVLSDGIKVTEGVVEIYVDDVLVNTTTAGSTCNYYGLDNAGTIHMYALYKGSDRYNNSTSEIISIEVNDNRYASNLVLYSNVTEVDIGDTVMIFNNLSNASVLSYFDSWIGKFNRPYNYTVGDYVVNETIVLYLNGEVLDNTFVNPNAYYGFRNYTYTFNSPGWYNFTASYGGNGNVQPTSTVDVLSFYIVEEVEPVSTTTVVNLDTDVYVVGDYAIITPVVSAEGVNVESGIVELFINNLSVSNLTVGESFDTDEFDDVASIEVYAVYKGTDEYLASTSDVVVIDVGEAPDTRLEGVLTLSSNVSDVGIGDTVMIFNNLSNASVLSYFDSWIGKFNRPYNYTVGDYVVNETIVLYLNGEVLDSTFVNPNAYYGFRNYTYTFNSPGWYNFTASYGGNDNVQPTSTVDALSFYIAEEVVDTRIDTNLTLGINNGSGNTSSDTVTNITVTKGSIITLLSNLVGDSKFVLYRNGVIIQNRTFYNAWFSPAMNDLGEFVYYIVFEGNETHKSAISNNVTVIVEEVEPVSTTTVVNLDTDVYVVGDYAIITPVVSVDGVSVGSGVVELFINNVSVCNLTVGESFDTDEFDEVASIEVYAVYKGTDEYLASTSDVVVIDVGEAPDTRLEGVLTLYSNVSDVGIGDTVMIFNNLTNASALGYFNSWASNFDRIWNDSYYSYICVETIALYLNGEFLTNVYANPNAIYPVNYTYTFNSPGWYNFTANYTGNTKVKPIDLSNVLSFYIEEKEAKNTVTNVSVDNDSVTVGSIVNVVPVVTVDENNLVDLADDSELSSLTIDIYVNGEKVYTIALGSNYTFNANVAGEYNISAIFVGNDDYTESSSTNVTITVNKKETTTTVGDMDLSNIVEGDKIEIMPTVSFNGSELTEGSIDIYIDGTVVGRINVGSTYNITAEIGMHFIDVKFVGNDEYGTSESSSIIYYASLKLIDTVTTISADNKSIYLGSKSIITVNVTANDVELESAHVIIYINGEENSTISINDSFEFVPSEVGEYNISAKYVSEANYNSSNSEIITIVVSKELIEAKNTVTNVSVDDDSVTVGSSVNVTSIVTVDGINLVDLVEDSELSSLTIDIYVNGEKVDTINLKSNYIFDADVVGEYNISAIFVGNDEYNGSSSTNVTITVSKKETTTTVEEIDLTNITVGDTIVINPTVSSEGSVLNSGEFEIFVNNEKVSTIDVGKTYEYIPDSEGMKIIDVKFVANDIYESSSSSSIVIYVSIKEDNSTDINETNGTNINGTDTNGTETNGTNINGTVTNGTETNGTNINGTNGTETNGTNINGTNGTGEDNGTNTNTTSIETLTTVTIDLNNVVVNDTVIISPSVSAEGLVIEGTVDILINGEKVETVNIGSSYNYVPTSSGEYNISARFIASGNYKGSSSSVIKLTVNSTSPDILDNGTNSSNTNNTNNTNGTNVNGTDINGTGSNGTNVNGTETNGTGNITGPTKITKTAEELQNLINNAKLGEIVDLGDFEYVNVSNITIPKDIILLGNNTVISTAANGNPIFIVGENGSNVKISGIDFNVNNGDVLVKAIAENGTTPLSIKTPVIEISNNTINKANDDVVAESITVLELDSERGILAPTNEIVVSNNTLSSGVNPFEFKVTSAYNGSNANVNIGGNIPDKVATVIVYKDMSTVAIDPAVDGRNGEYFVVKLTDTEGNPLANKFIQIGFNAVVYNRTTDENGSAKLQINLKNKGVYTFAICFLGDDNYNSSFVVSKITVALQKAKLTTANKSYKASAKTKTLTATFKSSRGNVISGQKVTFTVNGKTYSATTNSKGVATVKVSLSTKKTYTFTAKTAATTRYAATSVSGKVTIK